MRKKTLKPAVKKLQLKLLRAQQRLGYLEADEKAYRKGYGPEIGQLRVEISQFKDELEHLGHQPYAPMSPEAIALLTGKGRKS